MALFLFLPESELQVVKGQAPAANDPNGQILKSCNADGDCRCFWFWQKPKCENGKCTCH